MRARGTRGPRAAASFASAWLLVGLGAGCASTPASRDAPPASARAGAAATEGYLTTAEVLAMPALAPDRVVRYGSAPEQFGHLRLPPGAGPFPVVVVIHGGCWMAFADLEHLGPLAAALTEAGVATWNLEFRRLDSPGGGWPETFLDVGRGIDHLRELAREHPLDLDRVVTVGHSSGGHLALWAAARARIPGGSPLHAPDPLPLAAAISLAGPGDLATVRGRRGCWSAVDRLLTGSPEAAPEHYAVGSPRELLPLGVPQRLLTGADDPITPPALGHEYAGAARAAGDDAEARTLERAAHFEPIVPGSQVWPAVLRTILELIPPAPAAQPPPVPVSSPGRTIR